MPRRKPWAGLRQSANKTPTVDVVLPGTADRGAARAVYSSVIRFISYRPPGRRCGSERGQPGTEPVGRGGVGGTQTRRRFGLARGHLGAGDHQAALDQVPLQAPRYNARRRRRATATRPLIMSE